MVAVQGSAPGSMKAPESDHGAPGQAAGPGLTVITGSTLPIGTRTEPSPVRPRLFVIRTRIRYSPSVGGVKATVKVLSGRSGSGFQLPSPVSTRAVQLWPSGSTKEPFRVTG